MPTGTQLGNSGPTSGYQAFVADPVNTANGNYALPAHRPLHPHARPAAGLRPRLQLAQPAGRAARLRLDAHLEPAADGEHDRRQRDDHLRRRAHGEMDLDRHGLRRRAGRVRDAGQERRRLLRPDAEGPDALPLRRQQAGWPGPRTRTPTAPPWPMTAGRLVTVTEPAGRTLTFAYTSPVGTTLISRVTDHASRTVAVHLRRERQPGHRHRCHRPGHDDDLRRQPPAADHHRRQRPHLRAQRLRHQAAV